jgi:hypothetical protein
VVKYLLAPLAPVPCPRLGFLKVVPESLRFVNPRLGTRWRDQLRGRGLRSLCWRCARFLGCLALGGAGSTGRTLSQPRLQSMSSDLPFRLHECCHTPESDNNRKIHPDTGRGLGGAPPNAYHHISGQKGNEYVGLDAFD